MLCWLSGLVILHYYLASSFGLVVWFSYLDWFTGIATRCNHDRIADKTTYSGYDYALIDSSLRR